MRKSAKAVILAAIIATTGVAFATEGSVGMVKVRQDIMGFNGGAMKALGDMVKSGTIDAAVAQTALRTLQINAQNIPIVFETNDLTPPTKAKPEIWTDFEGFKTKAAGLEAAATAALAGAMDAGTLGAAMGALGGACQACHEAYRL